MIGSMSSSCHHDNGQCSCRPNVIGRRCERCAAGYAGLDESGCKSTFSIIMIYLIAVFSYGGIIFCIVQHHPKIKTTTFSFSTSLS